MECSDRGGANARAVVFVPASAMVAELDENVPFRVEPGKLMYPFGTRCRRSVYVTDDETRICRAFQEALCRTRTDDPLLTMEVLYRLS